MKEARTLLLLLLLLLCFSSAQASEESSPPFTVYGRALQIGDQEEWKSPDFDDSNWISAGGIFGDTTYWVRFKIDLSEEGIQSVAHPGLELISIGTYEAYWDGVYIGTNGTYGLNKAAEVPGQFISTFLLPDSLNGTGQHLLALRIAKFHGLSFPTFHSVIYGDYASLGETGLKVAAFLFILGGMFLFVGIYYLLLYLGSKKDVNRLVYATICLLFFGLLLLEYQKFYHSYLYPYQSVRLMLIALVTLTLAFLLPVFFAVHFGRFKHWSWKTGFATLLIGTQITLFYNVDLAAYRLMQIAAVTSFLILVHELWKGKREAVYSLFALLTAFILPWVVAKIELDRAVYLHNQDVVLFISFAILVFAQLYLLARRTKEQRVAYEAGLLRSVSLQNELLRKNIQPHFLMNTLTSLIDWVEESPEQSVLFIEALAEEFTAFNQVVDQQKVPLSKSIQLCKSHLKVMGYRKEIAYRWEEQGLEYDHLIPPGILLTLLENGVTHSKPSEAGDVRFLLSFDRATTSSFSYTLSVYAQNRVRSKSGTGTGLRYVRARLEESYGKDWTITSGPTEYGWQTTISVL